MFVFIWADVSIESSFLVFLQMSKFYFQHTYKYPWELVTHTHLTKYPTEKEKNILGIECIESRRGADNLIVLKMIVTCLNVVPSVFRKVNPLLPFNVQIFLMLHPNKFTSLNS